MTKRIFATVLALILCFTTFAIPTFAEGDITFVEGANNKITATWLPVTNAAKYEVEVNLSGTKVSETTIVADTTKESFSHSWTATSAGTYSVNVIVRDAANNILGTKTGSKSVTLTSTSGNFSFTRSGTTVTVDWSKWNAPAGVTPTSYNITYTVSGKSSVSQYGLTATNYSITDVPATSSVSVSITYGVAGNSNAGNVGSASLNGGTVTPGNPSTGTGTTVGTVVSGYATVNGRVISWPSVDSGAIRYSYYVDIYMGGSNTATFTEVSCPTNSFTAPEGATKVVIKSRQAGFPTTFPANQIAVVNFGYSSSTTGGLNVVSGTRTVTWTGVAGATYRVYVNGSSTPIAYPTTTSYTAQVGIVNVRVTYVLNGTERTIGTVSLPYSGNYTGSTSGNVGNNSNYFTSGKLTVNKGPSYSVVSWPAEGHTNFLVTYKNITTNTSDTKFVSNNSVQVPFSYSDTWSISVVAYPAQTTIGSITVYPTGSTGSYNTTVTTSGNNCVVTSTASSAQLSWNAKPGTTYYTVLYTVNGQAKTATTTATTITLPIGHANAFSVLVLDQYSNVIASADVKQNTTTGGTVTPPTGLKTEINGLELKAGSWSTNISWDKVSGATYYYLMYGLYGTVTGGEEASTVKTEYEIPFGANKNFQVSVFAVMPNGTFKAIGEALYIAGSTPSDDSDDFKVEEEGKPYVTNFKGTQGNNKIKLTYDAADDCDKYDIYYKKSSSDTWKKVASTSKLAVNISGSAIKNGTSYDFKIVANGNDSGILTISPSATSTKVVVADDPEGVETVTEYPVIKSAEGGNGTATIKWSAVEDAEEYKVYFATQGSNKYSSKATVDGTAVTIKGLDKGTYKVRIKALVDGEWTALSDCDYVTVTVK